MSFSENLPIKPSAHILKFIRPTSHVYLITGSYLKQDVWHYVEVPKIKNVLFERAVHTSSIDLSQHGNILASGWGRAPSDSVTKQIEMDYASATN